jgi:rubrerythrin
MPGEGEGEEMSIGLKCKQCKEWKKEVPDNTCIDELPIKCPVCGNRVQAYAIAHWMRDMNPNL